MLASVISKSVTDIHHLNIHTFITRKISIIILELIHLQVLEAQTYLKIVSASFQAH